MSDDGVVLFALGCFWGVEAEYGSVEGVVKTRVGYCGGLEKDPTYHFIADHTETVEVTYDKDMIGYAELVKKFAENAVATGSGYRQYMNAVFYLDENQKTEAEGVLDDEGFLREATTFYLAEEYHQKYYLQQDKKLFGELKKAFSGSDFLYSELAAKANSVVAGLLEPKTLKGYGVSEETIEAIKTQRGIC